MQNNPYLVRGKIVDRVNLEDGTHCFNFDIWPLPPSTIEEFQQWVIECNIQDVAWISSYYEADIFGDLISSCIKVDKNAPPEVDLLVLMKWS